MKKCTNTLFLAVLLCTASSAQQVDIFSLTYTYNPKVGLMNPPGPVLDAAELDVAELKFKFFLPTKLKNGSTTIINGLEWHFVNTFFDQLPDDYLFEANLHSFQYTLGINQQFSEKWGITALAKPTLASSFNNGVSSDDFYMQGSAVVHRTVKEGFRIGAGAAYLNGFGEPKVVPVLQLRHRTDKFDLNILAPVRLSAKYRTGNFIAGINAELDGNEYNLGLDDKEGSVFKGFDAVKFSRYNLGPVLGWVIEGQGRVEISAGISINRIVKVIDVENEETDFDLDNGFFVKTGFYFGK